MDRDKPITYRTLATIVSIGVVLALVGYGCVAVLGSFCFDHC